VELSVGARRAPRPKGSRVPRVRLTSDNRKLDEALVAAARRARAARKRAAEIQQMPADQRADSSWLTRFAHVAEHHTGARALRDRAVTQFLLARSRLVPKREPKQNYGGPPRMS